MSAPFSHGWGPPAALLVKAAEPLLGNSITLAFMDQLVCVSSDGADGPQFLK